MRKLTGRCLALAMVSLASLVGTGCERPTYRVLEDLPNPPRLFLAMPGPEDLQVDPAAPPSPPATEPAVLADGSATDDPAAADGVLAAQHPDGWIPQVREGQWRYVVIHHSGNVGGNAANFDAFHRNVRHWDELGYHFVICNGNGGEDGLVEIGSRWAKQKWGAHTGGTPENEYNNVGIGICLVGNFDDGMPSPRQMEELRRLVTFLVARYRIPEGNIIGHRDAPGASTDCPGDLLHRYLPTLRAEVARQAYAHR